MNLCIGPADLNIPTSCSPTSTVKQLVKRALALGYQSIALNTEVHQNDLLAARKRQQQNKKNRDKKSGEPWTKTLEYFPPPVSLDLAKSDYPDLAKRQRTPVILNRLTITVTSNDFLIDVKHSQNFKKFDILAIRPVSAQVLGSLLKSSFRFDIITFSTDNIKDGVRWNRKLYYECVENNAFFEIMYGPAIRDSGDRRRIIAQSHNYHAVGRSKNIFISSEAKSPIELRSPADVANLAFVFGLTEDQGKKAVNGNCHAISRAATGRKMGPFRVRIEKAENVDSNLVPEETDSESGEESGEESGDSDSADSEDMEQN